MSNAHEYSDRLPPQSRAAERSVLGACLRDNAVIGDVLQLLGFENFYADAHQKIFKSVVGLYDHGKPVDLVTLAEELKQRGCIEEIGYGYLGELWDAAPTAANAVYYAGIVHDKAVMRSLIHASTEILRDSYDQVGPAEDLVEQAQKRLFEIADRGLSSHTITAEMMIRSAWDRIDERDKRARQGNILPGIPTGYTDLDYCMAGFRAGQLIVIAARPSVGKTSLATCMARYAAVEAGLSVLFVSLEQPESDLTDRLLCCQARVDCHRYQRGSINPDETIRILEAGECIRKSKFMVEEGHGQSLLRIASNARRQKLREGIAILYVDYLQKVEPEDRRQSRAEQVGGIARRLKGLAMELRIPVVALAQLNRELESRPNRQPRLSDLRDSGEIEQEADVVMLMHPLEVSPNPGLPTVVQVDIAKHRNGPTQIIKLNFHKQFTRFENFATGPWDQEV